jgi:hypothetical protein
MAKINEEALEAAVKKIRKLRLVDHTPIMDSAPPAVTFVAIMRQGLGGMYEDAAIDYVMRHAVRYYLDAVGSVSTPEAKP